MNGKHFLFGESHTFVFTSHKHKSCLRHQNMSHLACTFWGSVLGGGLSHQSCMSLHIGTNNIVGGSINLHSIDIVRSPKLQTVRERQDYFLYFLCVSIFKCMPGLAPHYVSNDVAMHVDIHEYDTKALKIWIYIYIYICHEALRKCIKQFFCMRSVHYEINCPPSPLKNLHLDWFQAQLQNFKRLKTPGSYSSFYMHAYILHPVPMLSFHVTFVYSYFDLFIPGTFASFSKRLLLLYMTYIHECVYFCS